VSFAPADFPGFGGLNLAADAEDSSGALDLSNVTLSQPSPSRLLPRPGYTLAGTLDLSTVTGWSPVGSSYLMGGATTLQLVAAAGTQTATGTFTTGDPWTVVPFGNASSGDVPVLDNPSFATNAASWVASFSSITRDTGVYDSSAASGRWDNTGASLWATFSREGVQRQPRPPLDSAHISRLLTCPKVRRNPRLMALNLVNYSSPESGYPPPKLACIRVE
jgi:hypothetical protein